MIQPLGYEFFTQYTLIESYCDIHMHVVTRYNGCGNSWTYFAVSYGEREVHYTKFDAAAEAFNFRVDRAQAENRA